MLSTHCVEAGFTPESFPIVGRCIATWESGDLVVSNWSVRGTFDGAPFFGLEPSGEPVHINGTAILRIRDGRIVEHWGGPHCQKGLGLIV